MTNRREGHPDLRVALTGPAAGSAAPTTVGTVFPMGKPADRHEALAVLLGAHPLLPVDAARSLATHPSLFVRAAVAGNRAAPADVHRQLLIDSAPGVRRQALAITTDTDALEEALTSRASVSHPRAGAASNPLAPAQALAAVFVSEPAWVARRALINPTLPLASLDGDRRLRRPLELAPAGECPLTAFLGAALVSHPQLCALWAPIQQTQVRQMVARSPKLDPDIAALIHRGSLGTAALGDNPWVAEEHVVAGGRAARRRVMQWLDGRDPEVAAADDPAGALAVSSRTLDLLVARGPSAGDRRLTQVLRARADQPSPVVLAPGKRKPAPDVVAYLCDAAGPAYASSMATAFGSSRIEAAAQLSPSVKAASLAAEFMRPEDADALTAMLESTPGAPAWDVALELVRDWRGPVADALRAATDLAS